MISNSVIKKTLILGGIIVLILSAMILPVSASNENYLVFYMVGSDLESQDRFGSANLKDLADNWDPDIGDILVIYGGAHKTGWDNGLAITNLELLQKDLLDGEVGCDGDPATPTEFVLTRLPGLDISSPGALSKGLAYADTYAASNGLASAGRYLIFWDHGGGYEGFGANELLDSWMSVDDLKAGLSSSKKYDMIIFDACLMASLEVADALHPYADYLAASEENVPGAGLNYAGIGKALSSDPAMTPEDFGKTIITSFISVQDGEAKTFSLVRLDKTQSVVSSLDTFGHSLRDVLDDTDSLAALSGIYTSIQGYGRSDDGSTVTSVDLYEFADHILANTEEGTSLHTSAGNLQTALRDYVLMTKDSGHFSAANGVSIAAPKNEFVSEFPSSIMFGRNGWYEYFSTYMNTAGSPAKPGAQYRSGSADSRTIVVNDPTKMTIVLADYLYLKDGNYLIIGQTPLEETYVSSDSGLWISVPSGEYDDPDWDGSWFVLGGEGKSSELFVTMKYAYSYLKQGSVSNVYLISGKMTRKVSGKETTIPSVITAVVDMDAMKTTDMFVESLSEDGWYSRTNLWGDTEILAGDVFTPLLEIYNEEEESVSTVYSATGFTFGGDPAAELVRTTLDEEKCYWVVELDDYLDDDSFYLEEPGLPENSTAKSPIPLIGMIFGLAVVCLMSRRR
ncbi:hypothetical protein SDC9_18356 [bioreactor metagenome]|uniref:Clostripain n=1 Tax=bioreactor metagenome TaxID=1076179 RepID=A0A644U3H4_9ZZZZ|nr:clostripain-related cysteine peptidase [Methanocorpusculum sp.]